MTREPAPIESMGGAVVGLGKDLDGYVVELLQAPEPKERTNASDAARASA